MARCFCPCHAHPGTYPPPCKVCGHDTREGRMVGTIRDGWEPNQAAASVCDRCAMLQQQVIDRDRFIETDRSIIKQRDDKIAKLERLLDRAYPWLHNPYHGTSDTLNAAEGDAVIREVEHAIAHLKEQPDPLLNLPCASCDGDGCPNCEPPMVLSEG